MLDQLRRAEYEVVYRKAGKAVELPAGAGDAFPTNGDADRVLFVKFAGVLAVCHFFAQNEIEFDIDPREVHGQKQLDALLGFMQLLSDATGKDVVLTPENCREVVVFRSHPGVLDVEYREFGG